MNVKKYTCISKIYKTQPARVNVDVGGLMVDGRWMIL